METRSLEVLDEARHMIFSKMFAKADEVLFRERIEDLSERLKALIEFSSEEKQRFVGNAFRHILHRHMHKQYFPRALSF